ncbi:NAD(P)H-dependent oxidoreductase subunit E [Desulfonatronospira sp.]|uniref:NADH-quinone oxidoreductase subunit NuoE family protein n=1 Tax=Desulfonatronospira sp. TaxID=1962951 RepID=UPI0025C44652|nr:NAD(P)H-dependent oxidoreductase subunit E [Desulfonatronospira sp.]
MDHVLDKVIENYHENEGNALTLLQDLEENFGYVPQESVYELSDRLNIPPSRFFGIATFFSQLHLKPRGKNIITVCRGTPCHVKGSEKILSRMRMELDIPPEEETSEDRMFTVEEVNCVGACGMAPVVVINQQVQGEVNIKKMIKQVNELRAEE